MIKKREPRPHRTNLHKVTTDTTQELKEEWELRIQSFLLILLRGKQKKIKKQWLIDGEDLTSTKEDNTLKILEET